MTEDSFEVEVAYAEPESQAIMSLVVTAATTVREAIELSGILEKYPDIDLDANPVGIFSKKTKLDATLSAGDRIEIYRKLIADPKEARKKRAAEGKVMKKGAREAGGNAK